MLLDNKNSGYVGNEIRKQSFESSKLAILSSLFTIYGYASLKKELSKLSNSRLFLTDWQEQSFQSLIGSEVELRLINQMNQKRVSRECAKWIRDKVKVKASRQLHQSSQNLFHLTQNDTSNCFAIHGSATLTPTGLGDVRSDNLHMNTAISDAETTKQLLSWFDGICAYSGEAEQRFWLNVNTWNSTHQ